MSDITTNDPPTPNMPAAGVLTVLGFLVTPRFTCTLGTGEDAAASVSYQFQQNGATLQFLPITSNVQASGKLYIMPNQFTSPNVQLIINDQNVKMLDTSVKQSIDISITSKVEFNA